MKKLLVALLAIIVLVVVALFVGPGLIDWRPRVIAAVRDATGRELRIDGDLHVQLLPSLKLSGSGVHFANAPGMADPEMASLESFALEGELLPLLSKRLVIDRLVVSRPNIHLEVDKTGKPNWAFGTPAAAPAAQSGESAGSSLAGNLQLGDVTIEGGQISYRNDVTGQTVAMTNIALKTATAALDSPLIVDGKMTVNDEPVSGTLSVDTPGKLTRGEQAAVKLAFDTKHLTAKFDGSAQQKPVPGLNGTFDLASPSVGQLLAWLKEPLDKSQPDPGPLKIHAVFASQGAMTALKESTISGTGLNVKATGSLDASGPVTKLTVAVDSDALDIDRYLPPHLRAPGTAAPAAAPPPQDLLAAISDQPFDLTPLKKLDADVKVSIAGIKAMGYEVGRVALTGAAKGGVLTADIGEVALYGGTVKGKAKLDGSGSALALDTTLAVDRVNIDKLARQAGVAATGVASASLQAAAQGKSPRAMVESLKGRFTVDLGGIKDPQMHGISGLKLALDLPGPGKSPDLKADAVYNGEPVTVAATLAPPDKLFAGDRFAAKISVQSKPINLSYDGQVQRRPVVGLNGTFDADVPAVARLAAWAGTPLDAKTPDPGPLKLHAVLATDGAKLTLKEASLTGKAMKVTADATVDNSQKVANFDAKATLQQTDLNALLPPPSAQAKPAASAGWSTTPFETTMLGSANGEARVTLAGVHYRDLDINKGEIKLSLKNRVLTVATEKLALAQGTVDSSTTLDASGGVPKLEYRATLAGVQVQPLLKSFYGNDRLSGTLAFQSNGSGSGHNEKELVQSLNGGGNFKITDGAIRGIDLAKTLREAGSLGFGKSESEKTDFSELSGTFTIKSGVIDNRDMKMLAPLFRITGAGEVPMPPQTINYEVTAKLVASLQGQGGNDALAGVPIPIKVTGPWSAPNYQVDWNNVVKAVAADPARLKNLPGNLGKTAKGLGINVPGGLLGNEPQTQPQPGAQPPSGGQQAPAKKQSPANQLLKGLLGK